MRMSAADSYGYYMQDLCSPCAVCQTVLSNIFRVLEGFQEKEKGLKMRCNIKNDLMKRDKLQLQCK